MRAHTTTKFNAVPQRERTTNFPKRRNHRGTAPSKNNHTHDGSSPSRLRRGQCPPTGPPINGTTPNHDQHQRFWRPICQHPMATSTALNHQRLFRTERRSLVLSSFSPILGNPQSICTAENHLTKNWPSVPRETLQQIQNRLKHNGRPVLERIQTLWYLW